MRTIGSMVGIELLGAIEDFQSDIVALQPLAAPGKGFSDDVIEEALPPPRLQRTGRS